MQLALCLFLVAALLASVRGQGCSQQSLTDAQRVALIMEDNDPDKDGVTTADVLKDVGENYDTNNDQIWTDEECVVRFICRYGVTQYLANFLCADIMGGSASTPFTVFDSPPLNTPSGLPYAAFQAVQEGRLAEFASRTCVDRYLTVSEKVALSAADNDNNGNGVVDGADREYDLTTRYDTDNDGNVTQKEFVKAWTCLYGDDGKQARSLWERMSAGAATVPVTIFSASQSVSVDAFKATQTQRYEDFILASATVTTTSSSSGQGQGGCSQQSLTDAQRVELIMEDNDPGKDGVTTADVLKDVSENYDTNKDNIWTDEECVARFRCRYGVTQYLANFICADIMGGSASTLFTVFDSPPFNTPAGLPYAAFQGMQEGRLAEFASRTCVDRYLTVAEKAGLSAANNDNNNNGLVDAADREYDLTTRYDTDNDGKVTMKEFVKGWVCLYGDDGKYARVLWNSMAGSEPSIQNTFFSSFQSQDIATFKATLTQRYVAYATGNSNNAGHNLSNSVGSYTVVISGCLLSLAVSFARR